MLDGSGLAAGDRLSPAGLTALLRAVAVGPESALHSVIAGLPVAGWSGTLSTRYLRGPSRPPRATSAPRPARSPGSPPSPDSYTTAPDACWSSP